VSCCAVNDAGGEKIQKTHYHECQNQASASLANGRHGQRNDQRIEHDVVVGAVIKNSHSDCRAQRGGYLDGNACCPVAQAKKKNANQAHGQHGCEARSQSLCSNPKTGENMALYADVAKARELMGWKPKVSLDEGLKRTIDYFKPGALRRL